MNQEIQILTMLARPNQEDAFSVVTPLTLDPEDPEPSRGDRLYDIESAIFPLHEVLGLTHHYGDILYGVAVTRSIQVTDFNIYQGSALPTSERIPFDSVELEPAVRDNYDVANQLPAIHDSIELAYRIIHGTVPQSVLLIILQPDFQ